MMQTSHCIVPVIAYLITFALGCLFLLSDGTAVERMLAADASFASTSVERDKIVRVASSTRLGLEYYPSLVYLTAAKLCAKGTLFIALMSMFTTLLLLYYSDMKGTPMMYGAAFMTPLWILAIANIFNPVLKLLMGRFFASISFALFFRPFNWQDEWQVFMQKADLFLLAYVCSAGIGCAKIAGIHKREGIALAASVWLALYFMATIFGIEPIMTL